MGEATRAIREASSKPQTASCKQQATGKLGAGKPAGGRQKERLVVEYSLWHWRGKVLPFRGRHKGKEVGFQKLQDARDFAASNGYCGIVVRSSDG